MRKGPAAATLLVISLWAGLTTSVFATTVFHRLHTVDAQTASSRDRVEQLTARVANTDAELDRRWSQVDVALRAARPIRHEVNDALVSWLSAFRHARRVSESPVADEDTRRLLRGAATRALPTKLRDLDVIQRADQERDAFAGLVARRGSLSTELARSKAVIAAGAVQRDRFVREAKTKGAATDLRTTSDALTRLLNDVEPADPEFDFHRLKGTLARPVSGEPDHQFGATGHLVRANGWTWKVDSGTEVRAVGAGEVVYVGSVEGWGRVAVVDHGGAYRSIYAHLQSVSVREGDRVERAAVLGAVGESGSLDGPRLYVELRDGAEPFDPAPWFLQIE